MLIISIYGNIFVLGLIISIRNPYTLHGLGTVVTEIYNRFCDVAIYDFTVYDNILNILGSLCNDLAHTVESLVNVRFKLFRCKDLLGNLLHDSEDFGTLNEAEQVIHADAGIGIRIGSVGSKTVCIVSNNLIGICILDNHSPEVVVVHRAACAILFFHIEQCINHTADRTHYAESLCGNAVYGQRSNILGGDDIHRVKRPEHGRHGVLKNFGNERCGRSRHLRNFGSGHSCESMRDSFCIHQECNRNRLGGICRYIRGSYRH